MAKYTKTVQTKCMSSLGGLLYCIFLLVSMCLFIISLNFSLKKKQVFLKQVVITSFKEYLYSFFIVFVGYCC